MFNNVEHGDEIERCVLRIRREGAGMEIGETSLAAELNCVGGEVRAVCLILLRKELKDRTCAAANIQNPRFPRKSEPCVNIVHEDILPRCEPPVFLLNLVKVLVDVLFHQPYKPTLSRITYNGRLLTSS